MTLLLIVNLGVISQYVTEHRNWKICPQTTDFINVFAEVKIIRKLIVFVSRKTTKTNNNNNNNNNNSKWNTSYQHARYWQKNNT